MATERFDREKLIELFRAIANENCFGSIEAMVDYLIANGVTVQQWIPVSERLPALHIGDYEEPDGSRMQIEESDYQLVISAFGYQAKAKYETGVVFQGWVDERGRTVRNVTHWKPLLQPPKGE